MWYSRGNYDERENMMSRSRIESNQSWCARQYRNQYTGTDRSKQEQENKTVERNRGQSKKQENVHAVPAF